METESIMEIIYTCINKLVKVKPSLLGLAVNILKSPITKHKLIKENKLENCQIIYETNGLKTTRKYIQEPKQSKEMKQLINEALERLSNDVSPQSMQIIKENLKDVSERSGLFDSIKQEISRSGGEYRTENHSIYINQITIHDSKVGELSHKKVKEYKTKQLLRQLLSHELMHAASSHVHNGLTTVGLSQEYQKQGRIGNGINEGYTDLISQRYFCNNDKDVVMPTGYTYPKAVSEITELIIGKQKMLDFYFQGNLKGFIEELSKYQPESKVKQFILDLDTIEKTIGATIINKNEMLMTYSNRISTFLYNAFSNKMNKENTDTIDYLKQSKIFLTLFSNMKKEQKRMLKVKERKTLNAVPIKDLKTEKIKTKVKTKPSKPNGYINILAITILLSSIIVLSISLSYLILKVD